MHNHGGGDRHAFAFSLYDSNVTCISKLSAPITSWSASRRSRFSQGIMGSSIPLAETQLAADDLMITKLPLVPCYRRWKARERQTAPYDK
jgi:hypothetical protein